MPLIPILIGLIPTLVQVAEKALGTSDGPSKKAWVMEMLSDIWDLFDKKGLIPDQIKGSKDVILQFVDALIEAEVAKLGI